MRPIKTHRCYTIQIMLNEIVQTIVQTLRDKYNPVAILLHGSRAVGKERPHSDWDVIMLFEGEIPRRGYREEIGGHDVEWKAISIPVEDEKIVDTFDVYLQFAKVLWEADSKGTDTLEKALKVYAKGPNLSDDDVRKWKQFLEHKLLGMIDDINSPYMFFRHLSVFFNRASNMWFEIIHNEFSKPFYLAIPDMQARDPEFSKLLEILPSNASNEEKVEAGKKILEKLFEEK